MDTAAILQQYITQEILNGHHNAHLTGDDNLLTSGLIDSLGMIRLVSFIEEKFALKVPFEDVTIENFRTIKVIAGYLDGRTG